MLKLNDFFHLPELDTIVRNYTRSFPALTVVAGIDPHHVAAEQKLDIFLPSGRSVFFSILVQEILHEHPKARAVFVTTSKTEPRIGNQWKSRVSRCLVGAPYTYADWIDRAIAQKPDLLVVDRIGPACIPAINEAVAQGLPVISQLDTVLWGPAALRQMSDIGLLTGWQGKPAWIFSIQRLAALCRECREQVDLDPIQADWLSHRYPISDVKPTALYQPGACPICQQTGRSGDVAAFDVLSGDPEGTLPLERYLLRLAGEGYLALDDLVDFDGAHLRRTYNLLATREAALLEQNNRLGSRLLELETSHRLLQQRTEMLVSLQEMAQALISSDSLPDLANRVCRQVGELCGADRVVLYLRPVQQGGDDQAEVLAVRGWNPDILSMRIPADQVFANVEGTEPAIWTRVPPGMLLPEFGPSRSVVFGDIIAGLRVPLVAQGSLLGMLYVHSTAKRAFLPAEVALLQALSNQAALGIQRASLIEDLRGKIFELQAAQVELVKKERLERELELARIVQQSVLPKVFPDVTGLVFAAENRPARQVGGDFYDIFELDADHVGIMVADVSDKGLPAALYMALGRSLILAEARRTLSPRQVLIQVNSLLQQMGEASNFISVFYGVIDLVSRRLYHASAGHDHPLLIRGSQLSPLEGHGSILGVFPQEDLEIEEFQLDLKKGDRLVLYTDGITDVLNPQEEFYGLNRFKDLLLSLSRRDPSRACSEIFAALEEFRAGADQFDDMTLLIAELIG